MKPWYGHAYAGQKHKGQRQLRLEAPSWRTLSGHLGMMMGQIEEVAINGEDQSRLEFSVQFGQIGSDGYTQAGYARRPEDVHEDQRGGFESLEKNITAEWLSVGALMQSRLRGNALEAAIPRNWITDITLDELVPLRRS